MCGTDAMGSKTFTAPVSSTATNTTQVAGANDVVAPPVKGGGDAVSGDILSMLGQITKAIEALRQALTGMSGVATANGGGAMPGMHTGGGMEGCDMMGGGAQDAAAMASMPMAAVESGVDSAGGGGMSTIAPGKSYDLGGSDVAADNAVVMPKGKTAVESDNGKGGGAPKGSDVDDANGAGAPPKKGTEVADANGSGPGAPGKDVSQGKPIPTPPVVPVPPNTPKPPAPPSAERLAVEASKTELAAADANVTSTAAAQKLADAAVVTAQDGVTKAMEKVNTAATAKSDAAAKIPALEKALADAKALGGEHTSVAGDTLASVAAKYGITVDQLKTLNPSVTQSGALTVGTKLKLPGGKGNEAAVTAAQAKLDEANGAVKTADKALDDARIALEAARAALKQAEEAAAKAKKAAADAVTAAAAAKKKNEDAIAAEKKAVEDAAAAEKKKADDEAAAAKKAADDAAAAEKAKANPAQDPQVERFNRLKTEVAAASGDDAKIAVYNKIAAEPGVGEAEKKDLFSVTVDQLTADGKERLKAFFAAIDNSPAGRLDRLKRDLAAASGDDAKNAVYQRIAAESGVSEAEKKELFGVAFNSFTPAYQNQVTQFFTSIAKREEVKSAYLAYKAAWTGMDNLSKFGVKPQYIDNGASGQYVHGTEPVGSNIYQAIDAYNAAARHLDAVDPGKAIRNALKAQGQL